MQQSNSLFGKSQSTHHILIIDDNGQLRSLLARHVMLSCSNRKASCAIYRIGERSDPQMTFFNNPLDPDQQEPSEKSPADFKIYEAASPRHALFWLSRAKLKQLIVVSDVMMPVDTEVGLPGLLSGLNQLEVAVSIIFISSEPQSKKHVLTLMNGQQAYFLVKGSEAYNQLPDALIKGANRFAYKVLPKQAYSNPVLFQEPNLEYLDAKRKKALTPTLEWQSATSSNGMNYKVKGASKTPAATAISPPVKPPSLWARILSFALGHIFNQKS